MEILDDQINEANLSEQEIDWKLFIGNQATYYLPIWKKIQEGKLIHFNVAAFFLWSTWAGYRKMYGIYFILFLMRNLTNVYIPLVLGLGVQFQTIMNIVFFAVFIIWGLFANYIYYQHANKRIKQIKAQHLSRTAQEKAIIAAGNTDLVFPIVVGLILMGLSMSLQYSYTPDLFQ